MLFINRNEFPSLLFYQYLLLCNKLIIVIHIWKKCYLHYFFILLHLFIIIRLFKDRPILFKVIMNKIFYVLLNSTLHW